MRKTNRGYTSLRGQHRGTFQIRKAERITLLLRVHMAAVLKKT